MHNMGVVRRAHPPTILNRFASNGGSDNVRQHGRCKFTTYRHRFARCQTSKTRMCARLEIRTGRLASRRARAVRAKCSLAGLTTSCASPPLLEQSSSTRFARQHGRSAHHLSALNKRACLNAWGPQALLLNVERKET